jgi:hypothetical protein
MMHLIIASAMVLEASRHTLLGGATHVGGGAMVGLLQAFFSSLLSFLSHLTGIVLAVLLFDHCIKFDPRYIDYSSFCFEFDFFFQFCSLGFSFI